MKKQYISPEIEVIKVSTASFLATSQVGVSTTKITDDDTVLGHDDDFDW